jgi:hypothetical protein
MVPKFKVVGVTENWPRAVPAPESVTLAGELLASETRLKLPETGPAAEGENVTLNVRLFPAETLAGRLRPLIVNAPFPVVAWEIVTCDPPVLVTVSERDEALPTCTLPKESVVGFAFRVPGVVVPVPERATVVGELPASEVKVNVPDALPADEGANVTVIETL